METVVLNSKSITPLFLVQEFSTGAGHLRLCGSSPLVQVFSTGAGNRRLCRYSLLVQVNIHLRERNIQAFLVECVVNALVHIEK